LVKFSNSEIDKTKLKLQEMKKQAKEKKAEIMEKIKIAEEEKKKKKKNLQHRQRKAIQVILQLEHNLTKGYRIATKLAKATPKEIRKVMHFQS